jgi:hypothetical protein
MFWPRELSREYPHARILSFACDRNLWTQDGMHMMEEVVRQLISKLVEIRPRESPTFRRPIIWIAHSLGGWLVKAVSTGIFAHLSMKTKDVPRRL